MSKTHGSALALAIFAAACTPPPDVPPPRFKPIPPYPPEIVDPYGEPSNQESSQETTPPPQTPQAQLPPGRYPAAQKTTNPSQVISPYPPHNVIDVEGFRSGQLARDPSNNQIFRVP
jgi:hypothetical protein